MFSQTERNQWICSLKRELAFDILSILSSQRVIGNNKGKRAMEKMGCLKFLEKQATQQGIVNSTSGLVILM